MGISQAQQMLQQLQQQMQGPGFAQGYMNQLGQAGLGGQNPATYFGTPYDEQFLRQSVLGNVLGFYGAPNAMGGQYGNVGNPFSLAQGMPTDPFSGGMQQMPDWMRGGFGDRKEWKQAGKPRDFQGGPDMEIMPFNQGGNQQQQMPQQSGGGFGGQGFNDPFYQIMGGYNPQVGALNYDYPGMFGMALNNAMQQGGGGGGGGYGGGFPPGFVPGFGGVPAGIPQQAQGWIDQMTRGQMDTMNLDFENQKKALQENLFGRGMQASSAASDAAGRLLYGRSAAMNQITGQGADRALQLYQTMLENQQKGGGGTGGGYFGGGTGGFGGGGYVDPGMALMANTGQQLAAMGRPATAGTTGDYNPAMGGFGIRQAQMSPQTGMNFLQGMTGGNSPVPLNFEQQMQLAQMQLQQQQLQQQGQLGFGGLGLQRELGLGGQALQGQGLQQDLMQFLLNQGLQRQQGAAGFNQSDLARMQQYVMGQQQNFMGMGQQQAQLEAQKQSFWKQLALAGIGGASSLLGGMASGGTGFFRP
jgi:hypothetical protein